jgi:hypothetical protein
MRVIEKMCLGVNMDRVDTVDVGSLHLTRFEMPGILS